MIQAIIDVGSNTVRMAIYNIENADGRQAMELLMKKKHIIQELLNLDKKYITQKT